MLISIKNMHLIDLFCFLSIKRKYYMLKLNILAFYRYINTLIDKCVF